MEKVTVVVPQSLVVKTPIKTEKGEFIANEVRLGKKSIRLVVLAGFKLPTDADIIGSLYARKYTNKFGEFSEVAIFVENAIKE